jgi:hypothetical protein
MRIGFHAILSGLAAAAIFCCTAAAQAGITYGALNTIQYNNREQLATFDSGTHTFTAVPTGTPLAAGMQLYGVLASTTIQPDPAAPNVTGVFDIEIAKIINPASGAAIPAGYTGTAEVLFAPAGNDGILGSAANTYTLADGSTINGFGAPANALLSTYQGSTLTAGIGSNLDTLANQAAGLTAASDGAFLATFGYGAALTSASPNSSWGAPGVGYWAAEIKYVGGVPVTATAPYAFGLITLSGNGYILLAGGLFNPDLNLTSTLNSSTNGTNIYNNTGLTANTPDPTTVTSPVTFQLTGGGHDNPNVDSGNNQVGPWPIQSADPAYIAPATPEPGSLALMAASLGFGMTWFGRRRNPSRRSES